ncbi:MAG: PepSY domain-containing protein, partial [Clostridia bacterium]|nr:PepSY domain-containing protein [Clostridia bacterium]
AIVKYDKEKDDDGKNTITDNTTGSTIDRAQAKEIALAHAGLTDVKMSCSLDSENGVRVFKIEFTHNGIEYEYSISAANGTIIKHEQETEDDDDDDDDDVLPSDTYIGKERAQSIALAHAGLITAREIEIELDEEGGSAVYEVSFKKGLVEYDYEIDAQSGEILKSERELDD